MRLPGQGKHVCLSWIPLGREKWNTGPLWGGRRTEKRPRERIGKDEAVRQGEHSNSWRSSSWEEAKSQPLPCLSYPGFHEPWECLRPALPITGYPDLHTGSWRVTTERPPNGSLSVPLHFSTGSVFSGNHSFSGKDWQNQGLTLAGNDQAKVRPSEGTLIRQERRELARLSLAESPCLEILDLLDQSQVTTGHRGGGQPTRRCLTTKCTLSDKR